ncbi:MAG: exo-alpha-sialidase [Bacteroidales bacterium]|jgi:sialidase-1|nr:exo-alpha-sialidase [Bacteroidales bacterium]
MKKAFLYMVLCLLTVCSCRPSGKHFSATVEIHEGPVLALKQTNKSAQIDLVHHDAKPYILKSVMLLLTGTENLSDITKVSVFQNNKEIGSNVLTIGKKRYNIPIDLNLRVNEDSLSLDIHLTLKDTIALSNKIRIEEIRINTSEGRVTVTPGSPAILRVGLALRQKMQDGVHTSRIPGLITTSQGTLIALYDARWERERDLQGDIDICINRSTDGGRTWGPMQQVLDMGSWGRLPERYNGVSDGCILVDENTGDIYVAGLWMHGVLDPENGKWVKNLNDTSTDWNHQWRSFGSQPGYDVKQSSQFLITKSVDDGLTWSDPVNITCQVKPESWWLMAPAPGHGITLEDGTLVFPAEGRTETGLQISTIVFSKDGGKSWQSGNPAYTNTNECMAVQLSDGSIMLNMRERSNRGRLEGNGRAVSVTNDMGTTWTEHPTSRNALIEPACMASLHKHTYLNKNGEKQALLFFFNPNSKTARNNFTLKCSLDDGQTWPGELWILMDQNNGYGYSCITSIDNDTIGILYEGSGSDMVFQTIKVEDILNRL